MTIRFSKLTKDTSTSKTIATTGAVATIFINDCVSSFWIQSKILAGNGHHFTSKIFQAIYTEVELKLVIGTESHHQTSGQFKRFNATIVSRLSECVTEHQQDWDNYILPLTFAHNTRIRRATKLPLLCLLLCLQPTEPTFLTARLMPPDVRNIASVTAIRIHVFHLAAGLKRMVDNNRQQLQGKYKLNSDEKVRS